MNEILNFLKNNAEESYKKFSEKLIPDTKYPILGVRTPVLKKYAAEISKNTVLKNEFLRSAHHYYEEYFLHALLIGHSKENISEILSLLTHFMPDIDNWAICDGLAASLKIFKKEKEEVLKKVRFWVQSPHPYTVRFAAVVLLDYFVEEKYLQEIIDVTSMIETGHYYVDMALAWLYSVMLVKHYDFTVKIIEKKTLPKFIHNKTIQKANESFRIDGDKKAKLKKLKI